MASCAKENIGVESFNDNVVRLSSGIATRASGTEWAADDAISVFTTTSTLDQSFAANKKYATSDSGKSANFAPVTSDDYIHYPESEIDIYAIYPYAAATTATAYAIDVATQTNHPAIDLMMATKKGVEKSGDAVAMTFDHMLSQIEVTLVAAEDGGFEDSDLATVDVEIAGTKVAGNYNLTADEITLSGDAETLELETAENKATFMVIPQTATPEFIITVSDVEYKVKASEIALASGNIYAYEISVSQTSIKINGFVINDWTTNTQPDLEADDYDEPVVVG